MADRGLAQRTCKDRNEIVFVDKSGNLAELARQ